MINKSLKLNDNNQANQAAALYLLQVIKNARAEPHENGTIINIGNGDRRRKNHGRFYLEIRYKNDPPPARIPADMLQYFKLFITGGVFIFRWLSDGRFFIYKVDKDVFKKFDQKNMVNNISSAGISWQEIKKLSYEVIVTRPETNRDISV